MLVRDGCLQRIPPLESLQVRIHVVLLAGWHPAFTARPAPARCTQALIKLAQSRGVVSDSGADSIPAGAAAAAAAAAGSASGTGASSMGSGAGSGAGSSHVTANKLHSKAGASHP